MRNFFRKNPPPEAPQKQALDLYWDPVFAQLLETWGEDNAWLEIQLLLAAAQGKVLDIACGPGKVMSILSAYPTLELHGFDISDFLIGKAQERGLDPSRLQVLDATRMNYPDQSFDYSYTIGSLEHFTEEGIHQVLSEANRVTRLFSFHQIPVSPNGDKGWVSPYQSYFNNSLEWWLPKFRAAFAEVSAIRSTWKDDWSIGYWFVCRCKQEGRSPT